MNRVAIITLGCAKNTVDSELIAAGLEEAGVEVCTEPGEASVALINTCGFIDAAKQESIDTILEAAELKASGGLRHLIVCGCLSKRYPHELKAGLPEVDFFSGIDPGETVSAVLGAMGVRGPSESRPGRLPARRLLTPKGWAYLRISEGCSNRCSYCAIPMIRGRLASRPQEELLAEAAELAAGGVREINIIAQDTTAYGLDSGGRIPRLHVLLEQLCRRICDSIWVRLLYTHPAHYTDELIEVLAASRQMCPYIDLPLQHAHDGMLKAMGRRIDRAGIEALIGRLRSAMPRLFIRTAFIVGFPGEDEGAFGELLEFVRAMRFERLGAFIYSDEESTPAASLPGRVPGAVRQERYHRLMALQRGIALDAAAGRVGEVTPALFDGAPVSVTGGPGCGRLRAARSFGEAPEVDPVILVRGGEMFAEGDIADVRITGAEGYDLLAEPADAGR